MHQEQLIEHAVCALCFYRDRKHGRRLAVVHKDDAWMIGYQIPKYGDSLEGWKRGAIPDGWHVLDWLGGLNGLGREVPCKFGELAEAAAVAVQLRAAALARISAAAPAGSAPGELLIVLEAPAVYTLSVSSTRAGQWRWAVVDPAGGEVAGGGGYDSEDEAWEDGESELAVWNRPGAVIL